MDAVDSESEIERTHNTVLRLERMQDAYKVKKRKNGGHTSLSEKLT